MKPKKIKEGKLTKLVFWFVFVTLALSLIYSITNLIAAPAYHAPGFEHDKIKSDYVLMIVQCLLGLVIILLPSIIQKQFKIHIPGFMTIVFILFLYGSIYLGEVRNFYYKVYYWDAILHAISGLMLGAMGFSLINILNKTDKITLEPLFVAVFAFCFAIALGVVWEIYEFLLDGFMNLNMQKFANEKGVELIGRNALADTMLDLVVDTLGAFAMAVMGYISIKFKKGWIEKLLFKKTKTKGENLK